MLAELDPDGERAFEALVSSWPPEALDNTDRPRARADFAALLPEIGDPARLLAAGRAAVAEWAAQKRDYPPPALHVWLERRAFEHRLTAVDPPAAAWRFMGPDDLRDKLLARLGERTFRSYVEPCAWVGEGRALRPRTSVAERWIRENLAAWLASPEGGDGVVVLPAGSGSASADFSEGTGR